MQIEPAQSATSTPRATDAKPAPKRMRCTLPQPLEALNLDGALLRLDVLVKASGLSKATLYRKASTGEGGLTLVKIGKRCTRVRSEVAREFIKNIGAA